jgi:hypothetical protein
MIPRTVATARLALENQHAKGATMAAKKTTKKVNKTKYVQSLPATMAAKDVVEKGKADGVSLTTNYVYTIRNKAGKSTKASAPAAQAAASTTGAAKTAPKTGKKRGRPPGSAKKASAPSSSHTSGHVSDLYKVIARIVEEKVNSVLTARFGALLKM